MNGTFILFDGTVVSCDFREDATTRQMIDITHWEVLDRASKGEDALSLAVETLRDPELREAFDQAVKAFYQFHLARHDKPLPA